MLARDLSDLVITAHSPIETVTVLVAMNPIVRQQVIVLLDRMAVGETPRAG